ARCAARFVPTGVRKSRILSSAVGSLFASNSDDRARDRKVSMHVSRRVLMTMLNSYTPLGGPAIFDCDVASLDVAGGVGLATIRPTGRRNSSAAIPGKRSYRSQPRPDSGGTPPGAAHSVQSH